MAEKCALSTAPTMEAAKLLVAELNAVRTAPASYATKLERFRPFYEGKSFHAPRHGDAPCAPKATIEGVAALDECVIFLRTAPKLAPLKPSAGLCGAAPAWGGTALPRADRRNRWAIRIRPLGTANGHRIRQQARNACRFRWPRDAATRRRA